MSQFRRNIYWNIKTLNCLIQTHICDTETALTLTSRYKRIHIQSGSDSSGKWDFVERTANVHNKKQNKLHKIIPHHPHYWKQQRPLKTPMNLSVSSGHVDCELFYIY